MRGNFFNFLFLGIDFKFFFTIGKIYQNNLSKLLPHVYPKEIKIMHPIIQKTFGGLNFAYYIRHFLFGLIFYVLFLYQFALHPLRYEGAETGYSYIFILWFTLCQFLYPYSRFVYESVMNYILGENGFLVNAILMLIVKFFTMAICWIFSVFIAPIGLIYLYFYHSKQEKQAQQEQQ